MGRSLKNRWNNRSLRLRMMLLYVVLLAVLLATLSVFIYLDLRAFLIDSTETRLRAQAKPTIERFLSVENPSTQEQATIPGVAENLSRNLTSRDTTATVLDKNGTYLADGRRLEEEIPAIAPSRKHVTRALGGENEIGYTARNAAEERMLVLLIPLRNPEEPETVLGVVQLNTPLAVTDEILSRERLFLGASMLLALLLGTLGGLAITGAALEPLRQMISTCRRLASGDLGQRVNLPYRRDEIGQLARAFDDMAERLEATFASQQRFSADAAHELRTPLTALGGSLEVLLRGSRDDPQAANRLIRGMHREVLRLERLSEQLLDLSRLNSPLALNYREFPLRGFLEDFTRQAEHLAPENDLKLEKGPPLNLSADPDLLKQALFHLTDNAARHTPPGGSITIGWEQDGSSVKLWIADEGEGIPPEDLPHIFEPFFRGDRSRSRRRGGTGLGLALVENIVRSHGGRLEAESRAGRGSRFIITLPSTAV